MSNRSRTTLKQQQQQQQQNIKTISGRTGKERQPGERSSEENAKKKRKKIDIVKLVYHDAHAVTLLSL